MISLSDIKRGDLIFVKNSGLLFKKIQWMLGSKYDHVGIMLTNNMVIDATPTWGVNIRSIDVFKGGTFLIYRFSSKYQRYVEDILNYCSSHVGCGYDFLQAISLYILILLGVKRTFDPIDIKNSFVCSELIAEAAENAGFLFKDNVSVDRITPPDIMASEKMFKVGEYNA